MPVPDNRDEVRRLCNHRPITWGDRIVYPVFAVALGLAALAFLPSVFLALVGYGGTLFPSVARWLLIPYILVDLCSLYLAVTCVIRRGGPSGVGAVSLGYYALFSLSGIRVEWWWRACVFGLLSVFHLCCHYLIPRSIAARLGR